MKDKTNLEKCSFSTRSIHIGGHPDSETGAIIPPIFQTSTYVQTSPGVPKGYEYTRSHNPTRDRLEECLASLEGGKKALVTASGLSAAMLVMHLLPKGSTVLCGDDVYGGTYRLFNTVFNQNHRFIFADSTLENDFLEKIKKERPALIWLESPTNPLLKISPIKKIAATGREYGALTLVDNTFMSPYFQKPLELGADLVLHSLTKYINGHSDVVGGALIVGEEREDFPEVYHQLWTLQNSIGPCQSPFDSWLVLRGIKTLAVRMETHAKNAHFLATFLESHPKVEKVLYPGLPSHPQHSLALEQTSGHGGMISFYLKDKNVQAAKTFLENLELFALAESLGGVESLSEHPGIMTHASVPLEVRESIGLTDNLIRLSVGIENKDDLKKDLERALKVLD